MTKLKIAVMMTLTTLFLAACDTQMEEMFEGII